MSSIEFYLVCFGPLFVLVVAVLQTCFDWHYKLINHDHVFAITKSDFWMSVMVCLVPLLNLFILYGMLKIAYDRFFRK